MIINSKCRENQLKLQKLSPPRQSEPELDWICLRNRKKYVIADIDNVYVLHRHSVLEDGPRGY